MNPDILLAKHVFGFFSQIGHKHISGAPDMDKTALSENLTKSKENHMKSCTSRTFKLVTMFCLSLVIFGCGGGGSGSSSPTPTNESVTTATFKVENIPVTTATVGKSSFKIRVTNRSTGAAVTGKTITLTPIMDMGSMKHSAPCEQITDNGDGTYTGTVYYIMASSTMDKWSISFTIDGEIATFNPAVANATGNYVKLKGLADKIGNMTMGAPPVNRNYYLFNDGSAFGTSSTLKLFIATQDDSMMMKFPAVSIGSTLHNEMDAACTVSPMTVEASTDNGSTWSALTDNGGGHWSVAGLGSLANGATVKVRLSINGEQKTTDGNAAIAGTNDSATFTIVAGM